MQLLQQTRTNNYLTIARALSEEFATTTVERDRQAGLPDLEVRRLRESGLLPLVIPREHSGIGATWVEALLIVHELAKAEGSIGQLYANQLILSAGLQAVATPAQAERYGRATADGYLFWGNAFNTPDTRLKIAPEGDHYCVNGIRSFGTGVAVADLRMFTAMQDGVEYPIGFVLPSNRKGVVYNQDWDNMGQRRTASGSFTFNNVFVHADVILEPPARPTGAFATFINVVNQLAKTNVYLGIGRRRTGSGNRRLAPGSRLA
jgi:alkylation response protein AidB-like acyl-CoA dehydrogenase